MGPWAVVVIVQVCLPFGCKRSLDGGHSVRRPRVRLLRRNNARREGISTRRSQVWWYVAHVAWAVWPARFIASLVTIASSSTPYGRAPTLALLMGGPEPTGVYRRASTTPRRKALFWQRGPRTTQAPYPWQQWSPALPQHTRDPLRNVAVSRLLLCLRGLWCAFGVVHVLMPRIDAAAPPPQRF